MRNKTIGQDLITGRNPVLEVLKSDRALNKVFLQNHISDGTLNTIEYLAKSRGIPVARVEKAWLDKLTGNPHQGTAAFVAAKEYCDVQDILEYASERAEKPLIVVANGIMDPHNLGAIIRSAEAAGAHGIVIPKRNATGLTNSVAKSSAGAIEYMRVARASNISMVLRNLKKHGVWIIGADSKGETLYTKCDLSVSAAIVIGGESSGLGRLVSETCDYLVSLPMRGKITSLNAAATASVLLYEALRQRSASLYNEGE